MNRKRNEERTPDNRERSTTANGWIKRMDYSLPGVYTKRMARNLYFVGEGFGTNGRSLFQRCSRR
jgi:hypothetical protein